jgi:hypothetical protein
LELEGCPANVKIANVPHRFKSLGEKRNRIKYLGKGDYFCIWDDDDLYLPHRISSSIKMMQEGDYDIVKAKYAYMSTNNTNYQITSNLYHSQACITKTYMNTHRYPDKSVGEDADFEKGAIVFSGDIKPFYVYRWGNCGLNEGIHHLSGIADDKASWERSLSWKSYNDLKGTIWVKAEFQKDYWKEIEKI